MSGTKQGTRKQGSGGMKEHSLLIAFEPEDLAMIRSLPKYTRSERIRQALRDAGLIRQRKSKNPPIAA